MPERNEAQQIEVVRKGYPLRDQAFADSVPVGVYGPIPGEWYMGIRIATALMFFVTALVTIL